jgi:hypothetical protein
LTYSANDKRLNRPNPSKIPFDGDIRNNLAAYRINDLLAYNEDEKLCPIINEPQLYISSACQNTIWALKNYTRHDGEKASCKDPIDNLRYMATDDSGYIDPKAMQTIGGGSY